MGKSKDPDKATIVLFSGELDRALAAFNIATAAALMGSQVTIFFTFWGLNVIRKRRPRSRAKGLLRKLMRRMNKGGMKKLRLSRFNMWGIGTWMMKLLMKWSNMPGIEEMVTSAKGLGVRFVACTTTMAMMGVSREDLIDEVDDLAGAASYVDKAMDSRLNLFI
ncbi:MAG: DsrE/DsrF/DrsH-like family protein [Planctomycetota bacterium]|jgi:peroxiredoxin family protein